MIYKQKLDDLLDKTGLYLMKEYGLDVLHALEKMMCSPITQDMYDEKCNLDEWNPQKLGDFYMGIDV